MNTKQCSGCKETKSLLLLGVESIEEESKMRRKKKCLDCDNIVSHGVRCNSCARKAAWANGTYDKMPEAVSRAHARGDFGDLSGKLRAAHARGAYANAVTEETRRKQSETLRAAHERGVFGENYRRKNSEASKRAWAEGKYDATKLFSAECKARRAKSVSASWTEERRQEQSERSKAAWASGKMDGAFKSPSKPEILFAAELDRQGIEYRIQYRLEGDTRPFDFFISPKTLVEIDGHYFHNDDNFPGVAARDAAKTALAEERGYKLICVTDIELTTRGALTVITDLGIGGKNVST